MPKYNSKIVLASGEVLIDLTSDTVNESNILQGYTAHGKDGAPITGTCTYDSDTSLDNASVDEILAGKTAHARGTQLTGTMPDNGGVTGTISTFNGSYVIPQGYHDGSGTVSISTTERSKIIASNIREGVTILGVEGTMSGSEDVKAQAKTAIPNFSSQTISPDTGYTHLTMVTIDPIPVMYTDNAAGGVTVTIGATST